MSSSPIRSEGTPEPALGRIILINGVYGAEEHFGDLRAALAPDFATEVFSFRREGLPDPTPRTGFTPMVERLARAIAGPAPSAVDTIGSAAEPTPLPALVGFSLGGALALEYAIEHPDRISALVLVNAFARYRRGAIQATSLPAIWSWPPAWSHPEATARLIHRVPWLRRSLFHLDMPLAEIERGVRAASAAVSQNDLRFQLAHLELPVPTDLPARLAHLVGRVPILLISSRDDLIVPPRHSHWLAEHLPGVRHIELDGGHAFFQHGGTALASQIRAFLPKVG